MLRPSRTSRSSAPSSASSRGRGALRIALDGARRVLARRFRVLLLVRDAYDHLTAHKAPLPSVRSDLAAFLRLLKAWALRQYRRVPWPALLLIAGAVVYFVMPVDLLPDVLMGLGFVDDAAVITAAVRSVRDELEHFRLWEQSAPDSLPAPVRESNP